MDKETSQVIPVLKRTGFEKLGVACSMPFVADMLVAFAFDSPYAVRFLKEDEFSAMGMSREELLEFAKDNLRRMLPAVDTHQAGPVYMVATGNDFDSNLLLIEEIWEEMSNFIGADIVACVPERHLLFFTDFQSQEGIAKLREAIEMSRGERYFLSERLIIRRENRWEEFMS